MRINELIERLEGIRVRYGNLVVTSNTWLINPEERSCAHAIGVIDQVCPSSICKGVEPECVLYCTDGSLQ